MDGARRGGALRIAFLTSDDARQPIAWSGTPYYMARALARECGEVDYLGPVFSVIDFLGRARSRMSARLQGRAVAHDHGLALAREYAWRFRGRIPADAELLVAPAASTQIAFLKTDVPILYTSDATFALMHGYYPVYSDLSARYVREAHEIERRALERKGGPLAFDVAQALRDAGWPARLTVCGCVPPSRYRAAWLEVIPRLDKRKPEEEERLSRLLLQAAFLILPSSSECFGIVFCEASAHGTPSIATDTGGIAGAVRHGENGFLLPVGAGPEAFARQIAEAFRDRERYRRLVASSRDAYESRLDWGAWARSARDAARNILKY